MESILDWNGQHLLPAARSKGGTLALASPFHSLLRGGVTPWPAPEITQKLYQSRQARAFHGKYLDLLTAALGFYCDLQSLHSEDALTWSVFGPLAYAAPGVRADFALWLLSNLGLPAQAACSAHIWLWRRLPHPDTLVPGGPEIDFGLATESVVVLGEAKWRSPLGRNQGAAGDKDQIAVRGDLLLNYGKRLYPTASTFVIAAASPGGGLVDEQEVGFDGGAMRVKNITWETLCSYPGHPAAGELHRYLCWKTTLTVPTARSRESKTAHQACDMHPA